MVDENYRFVIALDCEALSIIRYYNLKLIKDTNNIFKCYKNDKESIWLIISGIGNINSAAATIYLNILSSNKANSIWINLGTGGHFNLKQGEIYHIKKVTASSIPNDSLYSNSCINNIIKTYEVINVDKEETNFLIKDKIYEMEAYGFLKIVEKFCYRELTCIIKVISDNNQNKPKVFEKYVTKIINQKINIIDNILKQYGKLANEIDLLDNTFNDMIKKKFTISFSNKIKVFRMITKAEYIVGKDSLKKTIVKTSSLKELIKKLDTIISTFTLKIDDEKNNLY